MNTNQRRRDADGRFARHPKGEPVGLASGHPPAHPDVDPQAGVIDVGVGGAAHLADSPSPWDRFLAHRTGFDLPDKVRDRLYADRQVAWLAGVMAGRRLSPCPD